MEPRLEFLYNIVSSENVLCDICKEVSEKESASSLLTALQHIVG